MLDTYSHVTEGQREQATAKLSAPLPPTLRVNEASGGRQGGQPGRQNTGEAPPNCFGGASPYLVGLVSPQGLEP